jgi:hypothetical protein
MDRLLSFVAGQVDMTSQLFLQAPLLKGAQSQDPQATCVLVAVKRQPQCDDEPGDAAVRQP